MGHAYREADRPSRPRRSLHPRRSVQVRPPAPHPLRRSRGLAPPGGDTTVFDATTDAWSQPAAGLDEALLAEHLAGDLGFEAAFVASGDGSNAGLGPLFNAASCERCHPSDGRWGRARWPRCSSASASPAPPR
ncbi:MAG: hypothetical protein JXX28_02795 [Deltaproteobacteria bacterium]|nr:hypothetical protein [Deltaproteobacteria bacterium]